MMGGASPLTGATVTRSPAAGWQSAPADEALLSTLPAAR